MEICRRYHPFVIAMDLWSFVKNSFFLIFIFILSFSNDSTLYTYGRILLLLLFTLAIINILLDWFVNKYETHDDTFHIYKGIFSKSESVIPFSRIQNIQRQTSFFQRLFKLTSLTLETGANTTVEFKVVSNLEASRIEELLEQFETSTEEPPEIEDIDQPNRNISGQTLHFTPTKKDLLKASFTSFSFLLIIPIFGSIYSKITNFDGVEEFAEGFLSRFLTSTLVIVIVVILLFIISIIAGIIRTFLKYGKYEIASDEERIFIKKGVLTESFFTISKEKVQAIEITQSTIKRILGLAEIKLISAGSVGDGELATNSLYPFLPIKRAYEMIHELLPDYVITESMRKLPKKSFWIRLLKPSWFWLIVTIALYYFKPTPFDFEQTWWIGSAALLVLIISLRLLDYFNTRFAMNDNFIQFKSGSFQTTVFISKREKIIEVNVTRSKLQQLLGLASIGTVNRAKPVHHSGVDDIPVQMADHFYTWYAKRGSDIKVE